MTNPNENEKRTDEDSALSENNIFRITDELVNQIDKTKKMIIIMIITLILALPVVWHVAPLVSKSFFVIAGYGTVALAVIFVIIGVRQSMLLSKWTARYRLYKELQKTVDDKLDFEKDA